MLYDCSERLPETHYNIGMGQGGRELGGRGVMNLYYKKKNGSIQFFQDHT